MSNNFKERHPIIIINRQRIKLFLFSICRMISGSKSKKAKYNIIIKVKPVVIKINFSLFLKIMGINIPIIKKILTMIVKKSAFSILSVLLVNYSIFNSKKKDAFLHLNNFRL